MEKNNLLDGKKVLVVDDEPDVLESIEDLLPMCAVVKAGNFEDARDLIEQQQFDLVILDIMGVSGYDLLELATGKNMTSVMLTAHALTPENIVKSYREGLLIFCPKRKWSISPRSWKRSWMPSKKEKAPGIIG